MLQPVCLLNLMWYEAQTWTNGSPWWMKTINHWKPHDTVTDYCPVYLSISYNKVWLKKRVYWCMMPPLPIPIRKNGLQIRSTLQVRLPLTRILLSLKLLWACSQSSWKYGLSSCTGNWRFTSWLSSNLVGRVPTQ